MPAMASLKFMQGLRANRRQAGSYKGIGVSRALKGLEQVLRQGLERPPGKGLGGVVLLGKQCRGRRLLGQQQSPRNAAGRPATSVGCLLSAGRKAP